ncbi:FAD dependent oxidoreductase [Stemphylium lycopersici]|uniref:FAD dependent oxidoreductase n=1 Tax=Stemphylium lycopersici TaxID=183478 RepID=A0A364NGN9_STELY|nr:FAD dependent oxidoreductase [Stemphylium lycopersici]
MHLDHLAPRAKKSIIDLFSRKDGTSNHWSGTIHNQDENTPVDPQSPDSWSSLSSAARAIPTVNQGSPGKETSVRQSVMGSFRKTKLRSINSLRNIKSPTKAKPVGTAASSVTNSPHTPKCQPKSSLFLNFEESPANVPIFDLSRKDSTRSGRGIPHSSPVPIPSSEKQDLQVFPISSVIPAGTVPLSPAPIQKILDLNQTQDLLSPTVNPRKDQELPHTRPPTPIQNSHNLDQAVDTPRGSPVSSLDLGTLALSLELGPEGEPLSIKTLSTEPLTEPVEARQFAQRESVLSELTGRFDHPFLTTGDEKAGAKEPALVIFGNDYILQIYHCGDLRRRMEIVTHEHGYDPDNQLVFVLAHREEDFAAVKQILVKLNLLVLDMLETSNQDFMLDEALDSGLLPGWLDLKLDMASTREVQNRVYNIAELRNRESTWGQHAGLYDGTGYGGEPSSRPTTAGEIMIEKFTQEPGFCPGIHNISADAEASSRHPINPPQGPASTDATDTDAEEEADAFRVFANVCTTVYPLPATKAGLEQDQPDAAARAAGLEWKEVNQKVYNNMDQFLLDDEITRRASPHA